MPTALSLGIVDLVRDAADEAGCSLAELIKPLGHGEWGYCTVFTSGSGSHDMVIGCVYFSTDHIGLSHQSSEHEVFIGDPDLHSKVVGMFLQWRGFYRV